VTSCWFESGQGHQRFAEAALISHVPRRRDSRRRLAPLMDPPGQKIRASVSTSTRAGWQTPPTKYRARKGKVLRKSPSNSSGNAEDYRGATQTSL
jgi:hypothetical protein